MIWIEKYKPKSLAEVISHTEVASMLSKYTLDTIPNLIVHGQIGHNKKTIVYALISHLYGTYPTLITRTIEIDAGSSKITVTYHECEEMVEICPSEYGYKDRYVVQGIIKEIAQAKPILSLFGSRKRAVKILIVDQAEDLSRDAQAALRRTMEVYSDHFRVIMICTEASKLIDPIRSRCLMVRVRGFRDDEIGLICNSIAKAEGFIADNDVISSICKNSRGNGKRAICLFELYCFNQASSENKRLKTDYSQVKLEWEVKLEQLADKIRRSPRPETMVEIRKELYSLLNSMIPPSTVLVEMLRELSKNCSRDARRLLATFAVCYEERIRLGSKPIYHLEAFAASAMIILAQKK